MHEHMYVTVSMLICECFMYVLSTSWESVRNKRNQKKRRKSGTMSNITWSSSCLLQSNCTLSGFSAACTSFFVKCICLWISAWEHSCREFSHLANWHAGFIRYLTNSISVFACMWDIIEVEKVHSAFALRNANLVDVIWVTQDWRTWIILMKWWGFQSVLNITVTLKTTSA